MDAEKSTQAAPFAPGATLAETKSAQEAAESIGLENTVMLNFPNKVLLTLDNHERILFPSGVNRVPLPLANYRDSGKMHPYFAAHGVTVYDKPASPVMTEVEEAVQWIVAEEEFSEEEARKVVAAEGYKAVLADKKKVLADREEASQKASQRAKEALGTVTEISGKPGDAKDNKDADGSKAKNGGKKDK